VAINENERRNLLTIRIADNGRGMSKKDAERAFDPFFTTKGKRVGLGLPFLVQAAEHCGGGAELATAPGRGTRIAARFRHGHIDRPPLTSMAETIAALIFGRPEIEFRYRHRRNGRVFRFSSRAYGGGRRGASGLNPALFGAVKKDLRAGLKTLGRT